MLPNQVNFSSEELKVIFGEENCINFLEKFQTSGIRIDSRVIQEDNIFVALNGENSDGHKYIQNAINSKAKCIVCNEDWYNKHSDVLANIPVVISKDTLKALGSLANHYRRKFNIPIITIGGANGKTSTKEMTAFVLSKKFKVLKTFENFNNQLGVPLMLFQIGNDTEVAVLEIGTNEPGEIYQLCSIIEPSIGLITNIGKEHLEKLIDIDGVELEETYQFGYLAKNNGMALVNIDDERLKKYRNVLSKFFSFGQSEDANLIAEINSLNLRRKITFTYGEETQSVQLRTAGNTTALNAIAAAAVAIQVGMSLDEICRALSEYETEIGHQYARMLLEDVNGINLINDCYNANPDSMKAALNTLAEMNKIGKRIAILGDMRELGNAAEAEHANIIEYAIEKSDLIYLFGTEFLKASQNFEEKKIKAYNDKAELFNELSENIIIGDNILVKGSRGMKMETIIENIKAKYNK